VTEVSGIPVLSVGIALASLPSPVILDHVDRDVIVVVFGFDAVVVVGGVVLVVVGAKL
jgi:hypothetical protein